MTKHEVRQKMHAYMDKISDASIAGKIAHPYEVDVYITFIPTRATLSVRATSDEKSIPHETRKFCIDWDRNYCSIEVNSKFHRDATQQEVYAAIEEIIAKLIPTA